MEQAFENLKKDGKNNVDNLVKWMQDSKVVEKTKEAETKTKDMFKDVADKSNVEFSKFKEILTKIATEQKKKIEDFAKNLAAEAPKLMQAGASAVKDAVQGALGQAFKK